MAEVLSREKRAIWQAGKIQSLPRRRFPETLTCDVASDISQARFSGIGDEKLSFVNQKSDLKHQTEKKRKKKEREKTLSRPRQNVISVAFGIPLSFVLYLKRDLLFPTPPVCVYLCYFSDKNLMTAPLSKL